MIGIVVGRLMFFLVPYGSTKALYVCYLFQRIICKCYLVQMSFAFSVLSTFIYSLKDILQGFGDLTKNIEYAFSKRD